MEEPKEIREKTGPVESGESLGETKEDQAAEPSDFAENDVAAMQKKLDAAETESKSFQERFLLARADLENYRKRMAREMEDFRKYAHDSFARDILPVMDNLERALKSADGDDPKVKPLADGVEMIRKELAKVLEKHGITCVQAHGEPFDPCFHQAVSKQPSDDYPENTVISEFQKGYLIGDRLLRPAMVVVSAGAVKNSAGTEKNNDNNGDNGNNGKTENADASDACET